MHNVNSPISVIFVGTGEFGVPMLKHLISDKRFRIPFIITAKDKPAGRGLENMPSPIKEVALLNKIIIQQPDSIQEMKQKLMREKPDFLLVISYGEIIPKDILEIPRFGSVNVHGSLLPKYRGASPIQEAILKEDSETGITWILMNEKMDSGDIIGQEKCQILKQDNFPSLYHKLSILAEEKTPDLLLQFAKLCHGEPAAKQDEEKASYCKKISKEDGEINPNKETAEEILRKIKAYTPWPGCFIFWNKKRIKIIQAEIISPSTTFLAKNSSIGIQIFDNGILALGTREGTLSLTRIQPESKKEMSVEEYLRGLRNP